MYNIDEKIKAHERAIEILEGIKTLKRRKERAEDSAKFYNDAIFYGLRKDLLNLIEIRTKAIDRLTVYYLKKLDEINRIN